MRKFYLGFFLTIIWLFPFFSFVYAESIDSFSSTIELHKDSSYSVTETITYNFGEDLRHGIYRTIPFAYRRNNTNYNVRITIEQVLDEKGNYIPFITEIEEGNIKVRIGDAEKFVSGKKTYTVTYLVTRGINFFDKSDELYWNISGHVGRLAWIYCTIIF